ncbi:MAG: hypothetical protein ACREIC_20225 [Limisphaerales bacterium]
MLTEALVYIGLVFVLLGIAYAVMYRLVDHSVVLQRNSADIIRALDAGERWRKDVRSATRKAKWETENGERLLRLETTVGEVDYRYSDGGVYRRSIGGSWSRILDRVQSSAMEREARAAVTVWRWELELQPRAKGGVKAGRVKPLFTFLAVPPAFSAP